MLRSKKKMLERQKHMLPNKSVSIYTDIYFLNALLPGIFLFFRFLSRLPVPLTLFSTERIISDFNYIFSLCFILRSHFILSGWMYKSSSPFAPVKCSSILLISHSTWLFGWFVSARKNFQMAKYFCSWKFAASVNVVFCENKAFLHTKSILWITIVNECVWVCAIEWIPTMKP